MEAIEIPLIPQHILDKMDIERYHDLMELDWDQVTEIHEDNESDSPKIHHIVADEKYGYDKIMNKFVSLGIHDFGHDILLSIPFLCLWTFPGGVELFKIYREYQKDYVAVSFLSPQVINIVCAPFKRN